MRPVLLSSLLLLASPALAQPAAPPSPETIQIPPELTDPAMADRLGAMMHSLSKAFLDMPIGEVQAAVEGRPANRADRRRTLRDLGRSQDPDFERNLQRQLADSRGAMRSGMQAMATALPAMSKALSEVAREMEKATANLPSPTYPKR